MVFTWNPMQYEQFLEARTRPARDLLGQIRFDNPQIIYDLGCGTGNITQIIKNRWPDSSVTAIDNSETMLEQAQKVSTDIEWVNADLMHWEPASDRLGDLVFSNATLQWLDNHKIVFPKLAKFVSRGGILAIQMPRNYQSPSHQCLVKVASQARWKEQLLPLLRYSKNTSENTQSLPVADLSFYHEILSPLFKELNIWETTYLQIFEGDNPVLEWMKGTGLRPILTALQHTNDAKNSQDFLNNYSELLLKYYPKDKDGKTLFKFKRLFIVAQN